MAKEELVLLPPRAFMEGITIHVSSKIAADNLLQKDQSFHMARMKAKIS